MEGEPSNSSTKSMLSQQSSRGAPPSEIETSPLYRVPNLRFFKYPNNKGRASKLKLTSEKLYFEKERGRASCNQTKALTPNL
jgi:hypothetical protein